MFTWSIVKDFLIIEYNSEIHWFSLKEGIVYARVFETGANISLELSFPSRGHVFQFPCNSNLEVGKEYGKAKELVNTLIERE